MSPSVPPPTKRAKLEPEGTLAGNTENGGDKSTQKNGGENYDDEKTSLQDLSESAWQHYRNYLESCEASEDEEGDIDELQEILDEVLEPYLQIIQPLKSLQQQKASLNSGGTIDSTVALLPVLISVVYYHLADSAIAECLELEQQSKDEESIQERKKLVEKCQSLMEKSLNWFPDNAAMWSMGANFGRMLQVISPKVTCQWYERAVDCAVVVRREAMALLEDEHCPPEAKEWIECLLLNHVAGVEYVVDEEEEEEEEEDKDDDEDLEKEKGYFSPSAAEATARFMASMLHSTTGRHDLASKHLAHFPVTHRLHPNLWQPKETTYSSTTNGTVTNKLMKYHGKTENEGVLPTNVYERLCQVFSPEAAYWAESDYNHRGYYSYYMDIPPALSSKAEKSEKDFVPSNVIEDVIWNHLYPLVQKQLKANNNIEQSKTKNEENTTICGAEWWVHTRPIQANLGHNLHFDTDEALLTQEGSITHPIYSSVLYLTGGEGGGATVVLDQTPDSKEVASHAWRCVPQDNSFLIFPGEMLHGVLPCPGTADSQDNCHQEEDETLSSDVSESKEIEDVSGYVRKQWDQALLEKNTQKDAKHRLTFLVGFWTRRVPDKMKHRKLYGPCGPMPPRPSIEKNSTGSSSEKEKENNEQQGQQHTWVDVIAEGYDDGYSPSPPVRDTNSSSCDLESCQVPLITPAWEVLKTSLLDDNKEDWLELPKAIDHRFFVRDAPKCFRDSLFEKSEDDEWNDEDDEIEESE